jgi:NADH-quinone oxidoreductase subunit E
VSYTFSPEVEKKFQWLLTRYPQKNAVLIPLLHLVQTEVSYLSVDAIEYVASRMDLSPARVREVASFYSLFKFKPCGKFNLQVCHNITCHMRGSPAVLEKIKSKLGIKEGETTPDGKFSVERVECLASCSTAPVMQVNNWDYHENLDPEKIEKIIEALSSGKAAHEDYAERMKDGGIA